MIRPVPTARPSSGSERPNPVSTATGSVTERRLGAGEVFVVLHGPAEGLPRLIAVGRARTENVERPRPVDRLGDTGPLDELEAAQLCHRGRDRARQLLRDTGDAQPDDLDLPLEVGEVDP